MRIVVTGAGGMLGRALVQTLGARYDVIPFEKRDLDVTRLADVRGAVGSARPDWVVHAAAYTRVDAAEQDTETAFLVNALGARNAAIAARESEAALLYYSTDYVFDGRRRTPYSEWDPPAPLNVYGKSKLAGENEVRSLCPDHLIVRTSWLFGPGGTHFLGKILKLARENAPLRVIRDQVGCPTYTPDLAVASQRLMEIRARGICNVANSGACSWHDLACTALKLAGLTVEVTAVASSEFPTPAVRPAYSALGRQCLTAFGIAPLRSWQEAVGDLLESHSV